MKAEYRYRLYRTVTWASPLYGLGASGAPRTVGFVMLNPSTATATEDDPTIRRCIGFARRWRMNDLWVANLFAARSPDPRALLRFDDPIGPENNAAIMDVAQRAEFLVCAWGVVHHTLSERARFVLEMLRGYDLRALRVTAGGHPAHPLYLPADLEPVEYTA